jgi:hypothetical protein
MLLHFRPRPAGDGMQPLPIIRVPCRMGVHMSYPIDGCYSESFAAIVSCVFMNAGIVIVGHACHTFLRFPVRSTVIEGCSLHY